MYCKKILNTLMYTPYRQSYELVIKVWLVIYVFPRLLNLKKHVTISLPIIPLNVTNNFLVICMIIIFPYENIYETGNHSTKNEVFH